MADVLTRSSVLFVKEETTEGTPVAPTLATDAVALQDGFDMSPSFAQVESAEIRSSIGQSKTFTGIEEPGFPFSHYLRSSGVSGLAPNFRVILKSLFGTEDVEAVEYATTVGSTVTSLAVTGIGANGIRGQALLIQDPVNGYRIRAIHSTTTNNAEMSFALPTAPGTGVLIGKPITYSPANTGHPTWTGWLYEGNGGAVTMQSGIRTGSMVITAEAGQLINIDFDTSARAHHINPVEITASTRYVDFFDDDGTFAAAVPVKWYKTPHELASAIQAAMNAANPGETKTVTYSNVTGLYRFTSTGAVLSLLFLTGVNGANSIDPKIGFANVDQTGVAAATGYTSSTAYVLTAPFTAVYDNADPLIAKNMEFMVGDQSDYACFNPNRVVINVSNEIVRQTNICAESGQGNSAVSKRTVTIEVQALLQRYDVDKFERYRLNTDTRAQFTFGEKTGGNWVKGKSGMFYLATSTVSAYDHEDLDGFVSVTFTLTGYVDASGNGEAYQSHV